MSYQIYTYPQNPNVFKSLIAAHYGGVTNIEYPEFEYNKTNRTPEFYQLNPLGKVPTLKTPDGEGIFESNAIARYIAAVGSDADGLLGKTPIERARVDEWIEVVNCYITPNQWAVWLFKLGYGQYDEAAFNKDIEALKAPFAAIERHFTNTGRKFLTGDRVTLADIILICTVVNPIKFGALDAEFRKPYPKTEQYLKRVLAEKPVATILGDVEFVEKWTL